MSEGILTVPSITCFWPGLSRLWIRGDWLGLLGAGLFTVLFNFALATSLVWPSLVTPTFRSALWLILFCVWIISVGWAWRNMSRSGSHRQDDPPTEDLFSAAQGEYLKGNWYQTQTILASLLRQNPRDVEARLMLLTMFRHTRRFEEARHELQRIKQFESSQKWQLEIQREEELLKRDIEEELSGDQQQGDLQQGDRQQQDLEQQAPTQETGRGQMDAA